MTRGSDLDTVQERMERHKVRNYASSRRGRGRGRGGGGEGGDIKNCEMSYFCGHVTTRFVVTNFNT